jgi:hypothetical protein
MRLARFDRLKRARTLVTLGSLGVFVRRTVRPARGRVRAPAPNCLPKLRTRGSRTCKPTCRSTPRLVFWETLRHTAVPLTAIAGVLASRHGTSNRLRNLRPSSSRWPPRRRPRRGRRLTVQSCGYTPFWAFGTRAHGSGRPIPQRRRDGFSLDEALRGSICVRTAPLLLSVIGQKRAVRMLTKWLRGMISRQASAQAHMTNAVGVWGARHKWLRR